MPEAITPSRRISAASAVKLRICIPQNGSCSSIFGNIELGFAPVIVIGTDIVEAYFRSRAGHRGIKAARSQYDAWLAIAGAADWKTPEDVKKAHPKASVLKCGRVVFNIKANDYRLIALVQYEDGVLMIRFFGSHEEYDGVDAETV
jgi:mRNA interferase HigB